MTTSAERTRLWRERRATERTCANCGEHFLIAPTGRPREYCSTLCRRPLCPVGYATCVICNELVVTRGPQERKTCGQAECQRKYRDVRVRNREHMRRSTVSDITPEQEMAMRNRARKCPLCGVKLTSKKWLPNSKHLDHIIPISQGGTHTHGNVRIVCADCNLKRPKDGRDFTGQATLWAVGPAPVSRPRKPHPPRNTHTCWSGLHPWIPENIEGNGRKKRCKLCRIAYEQKRGRYRGLRLCKCGVTFPAPGRTFMCPSCTEATARQAADLHASGLTWDEVAAQVGYGTAEGARYAAKRIGYTPAPKGRPLCPACGTPKRPGRCVTCMEAKAWQAVEMRQAGMTLEEIGRRLGYTSKTSVTNLMKSVVTVRPYSRGVTLSDYEAMMLGMSSKKSA